MRLEGTLPDRVPETYRTGGHFDIERRTCRVVVIGPYYIASRLRCRNIPDDVTPCVGLAHKDIAIVEFHAAAGLRDDGVIARFVPRQLEAFLAVQNKHIVGDDPFADRNVAVPDCHVTADARGNCKAHIVCARLLVGVNGILGPTRCAITEIPTPVGYRL